MRWRTLERRAALPLLVVAALGAACDQSPVATHYPVASAPSLGAETPVPVPVTSPIIVPPTPAPREPLYFAAIAFRTTTEGWAAWIDENLPPPWPVHVGHSVDGGHTWEAIAAVYMAEAGHFGPSLRFADARHGWLYGQGMWSTSDGGHTWRDEGVPGPIQSLEPAGGTTWAIVGCSGQSTSCVPTLRVSAGAGRAWAYTPRQPALDDGPATMIRFSRDHVLVAQGAMPGGTAALFETLDGGNQWTRLALPCSPFQQPPSIASLDGRTIWFVCGGQPGAGNQEKEAYISRNGGRHWDLKARGWPEPVIGNLGTAGYLGMLRLSTPSVAFLALARGGLLRSADGGHTWTATPVHDEAGYGVGNIWFVDPRHGWVVDGDGLYRTVDGGNAWRLTSAAPA